jgi:hypothetical protein
MCILLQLKRLSFSWKGSYSHKPSVCLDIESISPQLGHIEFLLIHIKNAVFGYADLSVLCTWLLHCTGLKELWVRNHMICSCFPEKFISDPYEHCN